MKWLSTKTHKPPSNDAVIVRICRDGYTLYSSAIYESDGFWVFIWPNESCELRGIWEVTHFLIPDAIELEVDRE